MNNYPPINPKIAIKVGSNKEVMILLLSLIASAVLFYFISGPTHRNSLITKQEILLKQKNLESKKELLNNIENFNKSTRESNEDFETKIDKLKTFIPNRNNCEDYLAHLSDLAAANSVEISDLKIEESKKDAKKKTDDAKPSRLNEKIVTFSVKGDFVNFIHFIKTLENGIPFVQETSLTVLKDESAATATGAELISQADLYPALKYEVGFKLIYY